MATVPDPALELEGLPWLEAARGLIDHVLVGDVMPQPWISGARQLVERAEWFFERAAA